MLTLIISGIFFISVLGVAFILFRKIPVLVQLPQNGHHGIKKPQLIANIEKTLKAHHFHFFEKQMLLQKLLSKSRILILKAERWIDVALRGIRKKAQELDEKKK
ncbi:MAG: hypothetical protein A3C50_01050 [Candidatus Staskawiczbacteria bacterium RIFCSPHIGHO2_02_FULL_43_16]|uniref:Uncharacterized protein n=1 Tax=Candidatus Staskawiczbacteria bacterium RIFCSPHIGHO2_01_FULL_41_41 TaxID=1802203 RepID=A0A1G2HTN0_9BACT|nr:MAG: hypothetical protein A2822_01050 [Candidatus Staskawiczbacteria bacterium RIFCSPHIGHO2_01_FULL_41_41]OGZ68338.1 MAG: hypothetical protein A3C50_01050 [Candidatus Staskawiczbacteria bacterium RIFCSPHIGHO2_02_FULL_43_16]OGZ75129.1 MAG: hypothetical protein A3A12_00575 [Candidatus Staskawiczbacteria bacterium RIFCSPLOWO2_01_FULL_43_17b]